MNLPLLTDRDLLVAASRVGAEHRALEVRRAAVAGELASRPEMVQLAGHARPALMLAELWGISTAEAHRLVEVGLATRARVAIDGSPLPARFELVGAVLLDIGVEKAAIVVRELTRANCSFDARAEGERALVERAAGFTVPDFAVLAREVRNRLDQDGAMPRDAQHQQNRLLKFTVLPDGMTKVVWEMTPVTAGLVRAGIDAIVSSQLRQGRDEGIEEERSFEQLRADAAEQIFHHAATCGHAGGELPAITMVIRMTREELVTGAGFASIDGVNETISATTARHLAAEAEFIPMVLDGAGMPLDYGRARRLFGRTQRLVMIERDDGCAWAGCSSPPAYGEAHHLRWWSQGGPTDLSNGVMLCAFHHHRIHNDGWEIVMRDHVPYVIPPPWVDPDRVPRRGGRVRLDAAA
ncbi:MAG: DUF222 domain-containing protein [Actinomycetota bacterium]